jgi:hypothetical protein
VDQVKETASMTLEAFLQSTANSNSIGASAMRGLKILSPSITRIAMATKAAMEAEVLEIVDAAFLKRKRGWLEEVKHLEDALQCQKKLFRGTFSIGADALRRHRDAVAAVVDAEGSGGSPGVLEALKLVQGKSKLDLKRVTNWCAVTKFELQTLEKKLQEAVDEVTAVDIEIALVDGTGDVVGMTSTHLADLDAMMLLNLPVLQFNPWFGRL